MSKTTVDEKKLSQSLPNTNLLFMILATLVTGISTFLYPSIWFFRRRKTFNNFDSQYVVSEKQFTLILILSILAFVLMLLRGYMNAQVHNLQQLVALESIKESTATSNLALSQLMEYQLMTSIVNIVGQGLTIFIFCTLGFLSIKINKILFEHYGSPFSNEAKVAPFILSVFYLQYKINSVNKRETNKGNAISR